MIRSILSIVTGYAVWTGATWLLWIAFGHGIKEVPPTGFLIFSVVCETIFGLATGYLAGLIAGRKPWLHGTVLAGLFVVGGVVSLINGSYWGILWIPLTTIFLIAPAISWGGWLRQKRISA